MTYLSNSWFGPRYFGHNYFATKATSTTDIPSVVVTPPIAPPRIQRGTKDKAMIPQKIGSVNRGNDIPNAEPSIHITLESINETLMGYLTDTIAPHVIDNNSQRTVPVIYGTPERWASVRKDGILRDAANDKLLTPIIMLKRTKVKQGRMINPNNKYLYRTVSTEWNKHNVYDRFAVQNRIRPSQRITNVMIPDYVDLVYDVVMWTEYQEQMDALIEQINVENYEYWGQRNNYKFRISIQEYSGDAQLPPTGDRVVRTQFQMTAAGYLLPDSVVQNFKLANTSTEQYTTKKIVISETFVNDIETLD